MGAENPKKKMLMRVGASAHQELLYILGKKDVLKRFYLLEDLQKRTEQCIEDCMEEKIPVCRGLNYADKRAKEEIQKFYTKYSSVLHILGIEDPNKKDQGKRPYDDGLDVIIGKTKH